MDQEEHLLASGSLLLHPSQRYSQRPGWSFSRYPKTLEPMLEGPLPLMQVTRIHYRLEPTQSVRC
jgi:hypothetical protein